ncbi:MAG: hypothetical protein JSW03_01815 [Candidatus Eiseniibacteriota bacterium]|nr:MAG: hypothetical protein JSW03_01815 [Candidatus Eisenbacteria bacterium]
MQAPRRLEVRYALRLTGRLILVALLLVGLFVGYKTVRWKAHLWLPHYAMRTLARSEESTQKLTHVLFLFVDHYEPGRGAAAAQRSHEWLREYKAIADRHRDSYGRKPQHTWFYAYEQKNAEVMKELVAAVYEGYGEVELHWHHGNDTNASFAANLEEALDWLSSFGVATSAGGAASGDAAASLAPEQPHRFGFVHGNWALDNSGNREHCGVSRELDILREAGCYADFTFPSFGSVSQPATTNSIYYARDTDEPKSYDRGKQAAVGERTHEALMIFEGPLGLAASRQFFEYGNIASDRPPSPSRLDRWVKARVRIKGRPEWIFVKVYTHGIQDREVVLGEATDRMFAYLEKKYGRGSFRLHYVTAREAFNVVRAAEDGLSGDPDVYRDYEVKEPVSRTLRGGASVPSASLGQAYDEGHARR